MRKLKPLAALSAALVTIFVTDVALGAANRILEGTGIKVGPFGNTLTLPNATDQLVGRATTDTLTNKSISGGTNTLSAIPNSATTATSANTNSAIVARDGAGSFSATTVTAALTGNASTATALAADPADCGAGTKAIAINASGTLSCSSVNLSSDTAATALPETKGGTNQTTYATGDMIYASAVNTLGKLTIGSEGQTPRVTSSGTPSWVTPPGLWQESQNLLSNNSWEISTTGYTSTGTGTGCNGATAYGRETGAGKYIEPGVAGGCFDTAVAAQTLTGSAVTVNSTGGLAGRNGVVSCAFRAASGTATHTLTAYDGTNNLVTPQTITSSSTIWQRTSVNFIFPASGTVQLKLAGVAADEPVLYIDDCFMGLAEGFNLQNVSQASLVGTAFYPITASCNWARTSATLGAPSTTAACPGPTIETNVGPGTIQTTDNDLPQFTVNNLPPGTYWVSFDGTAFIATAAQEGAFAINDGTTTFGQTGHQWVVAGSHFHVEGAVTYTATANQTFKLFWSSGANAATVSASSTNENLHFTIMRFPNATDLAYRPELMNWSVDASITGALVSLGTGNTASYSELTNASLALVNNTGNGANVLTAQIACASGTASSGLNCGGVNESIGVAFTVPMAGDVQVCADFMHESDVGAAGGAGGIDAVFEIIQTTNSSSAIVREGQSRLDSYNEMTASSGNRQLTGNSMHVCGTFPVTAAGQATFRLAFEQLISGTVTASGVRANAEAAVGQRDIHWTARPVNQNVIAPVLVGEQVVSKSANYTATSSDTTIIFTADATLSLPAAASVPGKKYLILTSGSGTDSTIDPSGAELVCGAATILLSGGGDGIEIQSDGANWNGLNYGCTVLHHAVINISGAATCSISSQDGDWVSSCSAASTIGTMTLMSGIFSAAPICQFSNQTTGGARTGQGAASSATSIGLATYADTGTIATGVLNVYCRGAR